ncbi:MAG: nucleoside triphosphate pyrophosphohydrolase, partial [Alphaproteobacteria bacterium]
VNLARHAGVDADQSLRRANAKFARRFAVIEAHYEGSADAMRAAGLPALEALWQQAKRAEKGDELP